MKIASLLVVAALFALSCLQLVHAQSDDALPEEIFLYDGDAPGSEGRSNEEERIRPGDDRVVTNVHRPSIFPYLPDAEKATGAAVIVAPGGGHNSLWSTHEGHNPAKYFAERGVAAFVLEYRLAEERGSTYTVDEHALGDMQRAIRVVRSRAGQWKIETTRSRASRRGRTLSRWSIRAGRGATSRLPRLRPRSSSRAMAIGRTSPKAWPRST
jgi:endo-1,4-beta-xylanase